jgi:hypothetical protein
VSLTFNVVPYHRALALMVNRRADIMLGPNRNSEREAYMFYIDEELPKKKRLFLHKYTPNVIEYRYLPELSIDVLRVQFIMIRLITTINYKKLPSIFTPMQLKWFRRVTLILLLCLFAKVNTYFTSKILILKNQRLMFRVALAILQFLESHH